MKKLLLLIICISLSSCVYHQSTKEQHQGTSISAHQVALIEPGKTTKQWVLANFGIPDRTQVEADGLEVFEYISSQSEKTNRFFIFLFNVDSEKDISRKVTRVVMRNGVVDSVNTGEK